MTGSGADKFSVHPKTGVISVNPCPTPGMGSCLDYEQTKAYFLSFSATDNKGAGKKSVVNLRITLADDNDNPPAFEAKEYRANIDENEANFQPSLIVTANDLDETSLLRYKIVDGNIKNLFRIDKLTGEIMVRSDEGLRLDNIPTNKIVLSIEVSDSQSKDYATVEIAVRDVNDRQPTFEKTEYIAMLPEDSLVGVVVEQVQATDADYGLNAELTYRIQSGAYDDFAINKQTGEVTLSGQLNYDTRAEYTIDIVAMDQGEPSLSGELLQHVLRGAVLILAHGGVTFKYNFAQCSGGHEPGTQEQAFHLESGSCNSTLLPLRNSVYYTVLHSQHCSAL